MVKVNVTLEAGQPPKAGQPYVIVCVPCGAPVAIAPVVVFKKAPNDPELKVPPVALEGVIVGFKAEL